MKRETDLTRRILQSQNGQRIIDFVAPIYNDGETALWLFESIGRILDDISKNIDSLRRQVTPEEATWTLPYWETEYNISPESYWNNEERRAAIIAKIKYVAPVNPAKLEEFSSAIMNVPCEIIENISKNTFRLVVHGWSNNFSRLKATINAAKPAHLIWNAFAKIPIIIIEEKSGAMIEKDLSFGLYANYWNCYCFNGKRCFDGSILFNQRRGGLNMENFQIVAAPPEKKKLYIAAFIIYTTRHKQLERIVYRQNWRVKSIEILPGVILSAVKTSINFSNRQAIRKIENVSFSPYRVSNHNTFGENANLTTTRVSRADGTYCFDGTLRFNGESAPKTENI